MRIIKALERLSTRIKMSITKSSMLHTLTGFIFPKRLLFRLRNVMLLGVLFFGIYFYWSGGNFHHTWLQGRYYARINLPRDRLSDHVSNRHRRVWARCANFPGEGNPSPNNNEELFPQTTIVAPNLFYCPVSGAASTFITRFIIAMKDLDKKSPFDVPVQIAQKERMGQLRSLGSEYEQRRFLSRATKFVFGRNPLTRIFSIYINKLYPPNEAYWLKWGQKAVDMPESYTKFYKCGAFIHFNQFVKLVVEDLSNSDTDLLPVSSLCQLCNQRYDVIGQVETAITDIRFLTGNLNLTSKFMDQPKYQNEATYDAIKEVTREMFAQRNEDVIKKCMNSVDMGGMVWRKLQILGLIDTRLDFTLTEEEMETLSRKEFQDLCFSAAKISMDQARLQSQRMEALIEAYYTIDDSHLEDLQNIYAQDFYLFGYDFNASTILREKKLVRQSVSLSQILNWQKPWDRL